MKEYSRRYTCPVCGHKGRGTSSTKKDRIKKCANCGCLFDRETMEVKLC
jgi:transcription elongation factor Elf1